MAQIQLLNDDCLNVIADVCNAEPNPVIVTDPPFNIGYHYREYRDRLPERQYLKMLSDVFKNAPFVVIHYPEMLYKLSAKMQKFPDRVISWVYNSNTSRQHRDVAFFTPPDMSKVRQPYKNPNDKRIKERIERGCIGSKLYDWWEINQVKNVSKEKTEHPCQMPLEVMERIVGVLPDDATIIDPFMGSGTTGMACKNLNRNFVGIEIDTKYFQIAKDRLGM